MMFYYIIPAPTNGIHKPLGKHVFSPDLRRSRMAAAFNDDKKVSDIVIPRILHYLRAVQQFERKSKLNVSSEDISKKTNISAFQVRKDLANFGKFGQPGMGYDVSKLKTYLLDIIGAKQMCRVALVGVGNLGSALLNYKGFEEEGLKFVAAFDKDPAKVGKVCGNVIVEHVDKMKAGIEANNIDIAIIAVSAEMARPVADKLIEAGVLSILNFAPAVISVPKEVTLRNVDLSIELKALRYFSVVR